MKTGLEYVASNEKALFERTLASGLLPAEMVATQVAKGGFLRQRPVFLSRSGWRKRGNISITKSAHPNRSQRY